MIKKVSVFNFTNAQKVLTFLAENPEKEFVSSEIQEATGLSRPGVYVALKELAAQNLAHRKAKGKVLFYSFKNDNPAGKQYKVLNTVLKLSGLIEKLKPVSRKIVLFGSSSRGEDISSSDIDLFVLAKDSETAKKILVSYKGQKKLQAIIKTQVELSEWSRQNAVFYKEIENGIILAEDRGEY